MNTLTFYHDGEELVRFDSRGDWGVPWAGIPRKGEAVVIDGLPWTVADVVWTVGTGWLSAVNARVALVPNSDAAFTVPVQRPAKFVGMPTTEDLAGRQIERSGVPGYKLSCIVGGVGVVLAGYATMAGGDWSRAFVLGAVPLAFFLVGGAMWIGSVLKRSHRSPSAFIMVPDETPPPSEAERRFSNVWTKVNPNLHDLAEAAAKEDGK